MGPNLVLLLWMDAVAVDVLSRKFSACADAIHAKAHGCVWKHGLSQRCPAGVVYKILSHTSLDISTLMFNCSGYIEWVYSDLTNKIRRGSRWTPPLIIPLTPAQRRARPAH